MKSNEAQLIPAMLLPCRWFRRWIVGTVDWRWRRHLQVITLRLSTTTPTTLSNRTFSTLTNRLQKMKWNRFNWRYTNALSHHIMWKAFVLRNNCFCFCFQYNHPINAIILISICVFPLCQRSQRGSDYRKTHSDLSLCSTIKSSFFHLRFGSRQYKLLECTKKNQKVNKNVEQIKTK